MTTTEKRSIFNDPRVRDYLASLDPEARFDVEMYLATGGDPYDPDAYMSASETHNQTIAYANALLLRLCRNRNAALYREMAVFLPRRPSDARPVLPRPQAAADDPDAVDLGQATDPPESVVRTYQPDLVVTLNQQYNRRLVSYFIGRDGGPPDVLIEIGSPSTARFDVTRKPEIYCRDMGVAEYYTFNPNHTPRSRKPALRGWRRVGVGVEELALNTQGRLWSDALACWLGPDDMPDMQWRLCLWDAAGVRQLTDLEAETLRAEAEARRADDERWAREAEAVRAETERLAKEAATQRAETERLAKEAEARRADVERAAREAAEAEIALLRAELRRLRGESGQE